MVSESVTNLSITVDTTFRKDLTLQGCTTLPTRTARLLACTLALFLGMPAEWERLQPLPCISLSMGIGGGSPSYSAPSTLDRGHNLYTITIIITFPHMICHHHSHSNGKLELEHPWIELHKVVS